MKLLVFAHRGEAQAFIQKLSFNPVEFPFNGLFKNQTDYLLICGEGLHNAGEKTTAVLSALYPGVSAVINIGVAGSLTPKLDKGAHAWIRTAYAQKADRIEFKSYTSTGYDAVDCISAAERVTTFAMKKSLSAFADLVDRELWAIASAAHLFKKEFLALKLVSDNLLDPVQCEVIKADAPKLSAQLLKLYLDKDIVGKTTSENKKSTTLLNWVIEHPDFYFTATQGRQLSQFLDGLHKKNGLSEKEELEKIMDTIRNQNPERPAKELTRILLLDLSERLNPLKKRIKEKIESGLKPLIEAGIQVSYDPELEKPFIQISHKIQNLRDLKRLQLALDSFNYQKIKDIFEGKIEDV